MTIALFLHRRRRLLALCAASALMHYLAIGWVDTHIGGSQGSAAKAPPIMAALLPPAELRAPAPLPAAQPVEPAPSVAAAAPPPSKRTAAPEKQPSSADEGDAVVAEVKDILAGRGAQAPAPAPEAADASAAASAAASATESAANSAAPVVPAEPPVPAPAPAVAQDPAGGAAPAAKATAVYRADLPPSARLTLDVARTDADGTKWSGAADMVWKRTANSYSMTVEAGVTVMFTRVNLAVLTSEGSIEASGIAPRRSSEKRRGRSETATHFDAQGKRITFSASEQSVELLQGAQDKASFPMQLAGIARADSSQFGDGIEMLVSDDKGASTYRFVVLGQEDIDTPMGRISTWHLLRPARPGAYNSRVEIWLAPQHNWYPVQIRNTESSGAVTTQTIRKIVVTESDKT